MKGKMTDRPYEGTVTPIRITVTVAGCGDSALNFGLGTILRA